MHNYPNCIVERRKIVEYSTIEMYTGKKTHRSTETEVGPCDTPLFSKHEKASGICQSCAEGWSVEGNEITERGRALIQRAKQ